jgi:hypothetical protein
MEFFKVTPFDVPLPSATRVGGEQKPETSAHVLAYLGTPQGMSTPPEVAVKLLTADFGVLDPADPGDIHTVRKRLEKNSGVDVQGRLWRVLVQDYFESDLGKDPPPPEVAKEMMQADALNGARSVLHKLRQELEADLAAKSKGALTLVEAKAPPAGPKGKGKKR